MWKWLTRKSYHDGQAMGSVDNAPPTPSSSGTSPSVPLYAKLQKFAAGIRTGSLTILQAIWHGFKSAPYETGWLIGYVVRTLVEGYREGRDPAETRKRRFAEQVAAEAQAKASELEREMLNVLGGPLQRHVGSQKIMAIKIYRTRTGVGLKEAKDAVEAIMKKYTD